MLFQKPCSVPFDVSRWKLTKQQHQMFKDASSSTILYYTRTTYKQFKRTLSSGLWGSTPIWLRMFPPHIIADTALKCKVRSSETKIA